MAQWIMTAGRLLLAAGVLLHFAPGAFSWFGRLPGDIRTAAGRVTIFVPVASMFLVSVVLTLLLRLLGR